MIYVTGDTHADIDIGKLSAAHFQRQNRLSKNDYVIICGDFGLVWDGSPREMYWRKWLSDKNFTTLWIDGNHENFDYLREFPVTEKFGGRVREISPSIYHLERGQVLTIGGKKFFVMGGAASHDKEHRREHISWWKEEMPSSEEMASAIDALDANDWTVDYVLTHCAPRSVQLMIQPWYENDALTGFLERVRQDLNFKTWFFGHYHTDKFLGEKFVCLYDRLYAIN